MITTFTLKQLQEEQKPWVLHNFGERPSWMPLMGIIEEYGEYLEACNNFVIGQADDGKISDAVCDLVIFIGDYCTSKGWDLQELWDARKDGNIDIPIVLGRIAHAHLKMEQGIRTSEDHDAKTKKLLTYLLGWVQECYDDDVEMFLDELETIWGEVKKRDWKKDSAKG